jgi:hypothetical protein
LGENVLLGFAEREQMIVSAGQAMQKSNMSPERDYGQSEIADFG